MENKIGSTTNIVLSFYLQMLDMVEAIVQLSLLKWNQFIEAE